MKEKETELDYLQMLLRFYMDHEDKGIASLLVRISQSIERMKACA